MNGDVTSLLKEIIGTIVAILITFVFYPLMLLDIILIPVLLYELFLLLIVYPGKILLDVLFPNRYDSMYEDSDPEPTYNEYSENSNNKIPIITGDHFYPRDDGFCMHQYSEACETCARRKKSFGSYTMGYHCHI